MTWAIASRGELVFRTWEDDDNVVFFNSSSGDTHLVDAFGMALLQLIQAEPQTPQGLAAKLADFFEEVDEGGILGHIDATLHRFRHLGIVVPLPH